MIRGLWTREGFSHHGPRYRLEDCHFTPQSLQRPHPTLIVGGRPAARRIPRLAARYADEYCVGRATPGECREIRSHLNGACERNGRDPASLRFALFTSLCVGETEREVQRRLEFLEEHDPRYLRSPESAVLGTPEQAAERLRDFEAAGVQRVMLSVECDMHQQMLPLVGERVAPLLAA